MGFVADIRRMNVAITRAKRALWILGNCQTLKASPTWRALIEDAQQRGCLISNASAADLFPHQPQFHPNFEPHVVETELPMPSVNAMSMTKDGGKDSERNMNSQKQHQEKDISSLQPGGLCAQDAGPNQTCDGVSRTGPNQLSPSSGGGGKLGRGNWKLTEHEVQVGESNLREGADRAVNVSKHELASCVPSTESVDELSRILTLRPQQGDTSITAKQRNDISSNPGSMGREFVALQGTRQGGNIASGVSTQPGSRQTGLGTVQHGNQMGTEGPAGPSERSGGQAVSSEPLPHAGTSVQASEAPLALQPSAASWGQQEAVASVQKDAAMLSLRQSPVDNLPQVQQDPGSVNPFYEVADPFRSVQGVGGGLVHQGANSQVHPVAPMAGGASSGGRGDGVGVVGSEQSPISSQWSATVAPPQATALPLLGSSGNSVGQPGGHGQGATGISHAAGHPGGATQVSLIPNTYFNQSPGVQSVTVGERNQPAGNLEGWQGQQTVQQHHPQLLGAPSGTLPRSPDQAQNAQSVPIVGVSAGDVGLVASRLANVHGLPSQLPETLGLMSVRPTGPSFQGSVFSNQAVGIGGFADPAGAAQMQGIVPQMAQHWAQGGRVQPLLEPIAQHTGQIGPHTTPQVVSVVNGVGPSGQDGQIAPGRHLVSALPQGQLVYNQQRPSPNVFQIAGLQPGLQFTGISDSFQGQQALVQVQGGPGVQIQSGGQTQQAIVWLHPNQGGLVGTTRPSVQTGDVATAMDANARRDQTQQR